MMLMPFELFPVSIFFPFLSAIITDREEEQVIVRGPRCMMGTSSPDFMLIHSNSFPLLS